MSKETFNESEAHNNHVSFSNSLLADQYKCTKFPEHALINWFVGDPPVVTDITQTGIAVQGMVPMASTSNM